MTDKNNNVMDRLLPKVFILSARAFYKDNCGLLAAAIAYYVLFSMFPLLILSVSIFGRFLNNGSVQDQILDLVYLYVPGKDIGNENLLIREIREVTQAGGKTFGIIGLLGLAWSGSNLFGVIRQSVNLAFNIESRRRFYRKKILDFVMMILTGFLLLSSILATVLIQGVEALTVYIPYFAANVRSLWWNSSGFLIPMLLSMTAFLLIYRIFPATQVRFKDVLPGALLTTVLFEFGKRVFGFYLMNFAKYDVIFGSLGAIVSFLLWMYISSAILLFGAEFCSEYRRFRKLHGIHEIQSHQ